MCRDDHALSVEIKHYRERSDQTESACGQESGPGWPGPGCPGPAAASGPQSCADQPLGGPPR